VLTALVATWLVRRIPPHLLGVLVGGVILLTNARTLAMTVDLRPAASAVAYLSIATLWLAALAYVVLSRRFHTTPQCVSR
jgi:hypothetical protein